MSSDIPRQTKIISIHTGECYPFYSVDSDPEDYQTQYEIPLDEYEWLVHAYENFKEYQMRLRGYLTSHTKVKEEES